MIAWWVLCVCGFAVRRASWSSAASTADWHAREGCEGADHVMSIEYRDARIVDKREMRA